MGEECTAGPHPQPPLPSSRERGLSAPGTPLSESEESNGERLCDTRGMARTPTSVHRHNVLAARDLRACETSAEDLLWVALRGRRLAGLKFRRQHPIGPFVLDFCCVERRLAVELDGEVHATQQAHDAERETLIIAAGYRVLRVPNAAVRDDLSQVLAAIQAAAREEPVPRPRAPGRAAGWS